MIPLNLKISGFLSYRDPVEVDFSGFDLACISGSNGAGKSSLLDAITWAFFGQARKRDEALINLQSKAAEVVFTFAYETNVYRVIRSLARGKTTALEFQIADDGRPASVDRPQTIDHGQSSVVHGSSSPMTRDTDGQSSTVNGRPRTWRPLTERTLRDTQARIEQILRLDYETFVNVSFFLQGRADQFAQQPPTRRKEILGNILGLEAWETYRERAAERRKAVERDLDAVDGRVAEIDSELAEEEPRKAHLAELDSQLKGLADSRKLLEAALSNARQAQATLDRQRELVRKLGQALEQAQANRTGLQSRLESRQAERGTHAELARRAPEIEAAYANLQKARLDLEKWEQVAERFREYDGRRQPALREIESERARLEQEQLGLQEQGESIGSQARLAGGYELELAESRQALEQAESQLAGRLALQKQIQEQREKQAELRAENTGLRTKMNEYEERIKKLTAAEGAVCPLCGQSLSPEHRQSTLEQLRQEGGQLGDRYRANKAGMDTLALTIADQEAEFTRTASADTGRLSASNSVAQLSERLESFARQSAEWEHSGSKRLAELTKLLEKEKFAPVARKLLAGVDKELAALGYEAAAHDAARRVEVQARPAEAEYRALASARAALKPLEDEIANLNAALSSQESAVSDQTREFDESAAALASAEAQAPDLEGAEHSLLDIQERENRLHQEVGGARQKVSVLDELRKRKKRLEAERGELGLQIGRYKALERAFGKDGVPALLIEQALPEIEMKANEILGRLSEDSMRLHFETQARYKDEKRKDLRETLEIQVSDGAGLRDYEMYSGGEAFRVNFAIRLALSEVLAQRKGARLQMLIIDEGFGSQDALGRQRLIQAINAVKHDFAKILVITHLEELKDVFPTRIEVEKTETGSRVVVS